MSHSDHSVEVSTSSPVPESVVHPSVNQWLLMEGNRWILAGGFSAVVAVVFFVLGWSGVIGVSTEGPITALLSSFIAGNLTLVPIAITINQLVLSREFGKPHELRERDEGVRQLRRELKELAAIPLIPPAPAAFLRELLGFVDESADDIHEAAAATDDEELLRRAETYRERVTAGTSQVRDELDSSDFGSYKLLSAMLQLNSAWLIESAHYLQHGHEESLPEEPFDQMDQALRLFNITRQYTKTLYTQKEIATLSRLVLYTGFLAVFLPGLAILFYPTPMEAALSPTTLLVAFSLLGAVMVSPLAFLISYMLRLSTLMSYPPLRNSFITDG